MMTAYRPIRSLSWLQGRKIKILASCAISDGKCGCQMYNCNSTPRRQRQTDDDYHHYYSESCHRSFRSSASSHKQECLPFRSSSHWRRNDVIQKICKRQIHSVGSRRKLLKGGRANRKMTLKQSTYKECTEQSEAISDLEESTDVANTNSIRNESDYNHNGDSSKNILFGVPMGNPLRDRYIRSQQRINYPNTLSGWKDVVRSTKDTYLWTFEGFLLPKKKRDEHGNIIPEEDDEGEEENTNIRDKAKVTANQMAGNLQKNISTIQQEAPKIVEMGQQVTGISSREELREWVGEQLKLGTACLNAFMQGYKQGRDDEVDKMLHEYFNDLDEGKKETATNDVDEAQKEVGNDSPPSSTNTKQRRLWGRMERRRTKAIKNYKQSASIKTN